MKPIFKFWIFIEIWKVLIAAICLYVEEVSEHNTLIIFLFIVLAISICINMVRMVPVLKKLINFVLISNDIEERNFLVKTRNILLLLVILDWIPLLLLFTQAWLRYKYYKLEPKANQIIKDISLKHIEIYNVN